MAVELNHPRVPVPEALPEALSLGDDDRHVGQLDLVPDRSRLRVHELADAVEHLLFHGQDLGVDLAPVERVRERRVARDSLAIHSLAPVATAHRGIDIGPPFDQLDLIHCRIDTEPDIKRSAIFTRTSKEHCLVRAAKYQRVAPTWFVDQVRGDPEVDEDLPQPPHIVATVSYTHLTLPT